MATIGSTPTILGRVTVREVAGVFRARDVLDAAVGALLSSGFDRADIDVVVGAEAREKLGGVKIAAEELPDVPAAPRQPFIAREDVVLVWSMVLSIPTFAAAGLAACLVVRSGAHLIWAGVAATVAAVAAGWLGVQVTRAFARKRIRDLVAQLTSRDLVYWCAFVPPEKRRRPPISCLGMGRKRFARTRSQSISAWSICPCIRCGSIPGSATNLWSTFRELQVGRVRTV